MNLEIITPGEKLFQGEVNIVSVPGTKGPFTILKNHAPIISTLEKGTVKIVDKHNETTYIDVLGGIVEVNRNKIIVLADIE